MARGVGVGWGGERGGGGVFAIVAPFAFSSAVGVWREGGGGGVGM